MSRAKPRFSRTNPSLPAAVPNLFQVTVMGQLESQVTINTFYYADGGAALITASEQNIASGWNTTFLPSYAACLSSDWSAISIKVQCLTSPNRIPFTLAVTGNGTGPSGHEPTTVCTTIDRMSGVKGQAGRGRVSMPAVPTTWVTASQLNATGVLAYATWVTNLKTGFTATGVTYVAQIVSRKNRYGPALGASPVLNTLLQKTLGSCRRRKLLRGK